MTIEQFWRTISVTANPDKCWIWNGGKTVDGYGQTLMNGRTIRCHRIAYALEYGPIPDGLHICHRCDVRLCCNPTHLFAGTNRDNVNDKMSKGRQAKGMQHSKAKLTDADVLEIRRLYQRNKFGQTKLKRMFGVSGPVIFGIIHGKYWKHLLPDGWTDTPHDTCQLTDADVSEIRRLRQLGATTSELVSKFHVGKSTISRVLRGGTMQFARTL